MKNKKKDPSKPPFITSTLQQTSSSFGFSLSKTMKLAQDLYGGYISYMCTDSPNISVLAQNNCKQYLLDTLGKRKFSKNYASKASNTQSMKL